MTKELTPQEVLANLFESTESPATLSHHPEDVQRFSAAIIKHLTDSGFAIVDARELADLRDATEQLYSL